MTNKTDYAALDSAILDAICAGRREFSDIAYRGEVDARAKALASAESAPSWRIVDRRLQAMRKAGKLTYKRASKKNPGGGWAIVKEYPDA